jgi:rhamnosyltransferase
MNIQDVCAVVVIYSPDSTAVDNLEVVANIFDKIYVIDNSESKRNNVDLSLICNSGSVTYVQNNDNYGIATALNQGVELAAKNGYLGVVLLDQDTKPNKKLLDELVYIYNERSQVTPVAIIGSNYSISAFSPKKKLFRSVSATTVITSGSLLNIEAYRGIGPFNENYFIDGVDSEYCLRAHLSGFAVYKSTAVLMKHSIGAETKHRLFNLTFTSSNHSGLRRYYLARNTIFLCRDFFKSFPLYSPTAGINVIRISIYILLFESEKKIKLMCLLLGLKDGFFNITGKKVFK